METIKIEELRERTELGEGIEISQYAPIKEKMSAAKTLIEMILEKDETEMVKCDPIKKMVMKALSVIVLYTNIELAEDAYENYDILMKNGLLYSIEDKIGDDFIEFYDIVDDLLMDKLMENSMNHILSKKADDLMMVINRAGRHLDEMLDKGDPNIIAKYLGEALKPLIAKLPDLSALDIAKIVKEARK